MARAPLTLVSQAVCSRGLSPVWRVSGCLRLFLDGLTWLVTVMSPGRKALSLLVLSLLPVDTLDPQVPAPLTHDLMSLL